MEGLETQEVDEEEEEELEEAKRVMEKDVEGWRRGAMKGSREAVPEWSPCGRGVLEDPASSPARRFKQTIFTHRGRGRGRGGGRCGGSGEGGIIG